MNSGNHSKVALITGGGRRVGNVVARALAQDGYAVAIHYHTSSEQANALVEELGATGIACAAFPADVSDERQVDRLFDDVLARFGRLDVLVTAAAIWEAISLEQVTAADLRRNFEVNTLGTFLCARRAGLIMAAQPQGGAIVTIGDWAIERPYLDYAPYFVSKGAIPTLTRTLAVELAQRNPRVRVNCIQPGPVLFPPKATEAERREMLESTLARMANCPEWLAHAVKFLIDNPFVTGVCLPVDGGRSIYAGEYRRRDSAT